MFPSPRWHPDARAMWKALPALCCALDKNGDRNARRVSTTGDEF